VAVELAFFDTVEFGGTDPVALVVGDPELVVLIEVEAVGGAEAGGVELGFSGVGYFA